MKKPLKQLLSIVICAALLFTCVPAAVFAGRSDQCGDNAFYSYADGALLIYGSGKVAANKILIPSGESVTSVTVKNGITELPAGIFRNYTDVTRAELPSTLCAVPDNAFDGCASLAKISMPKNVKSVGKEAFKNCASLVSAVLPEGLQRLGAGCFEGCALLESIVIPFGVDSVPEKAFYNCTGLKTAGIPASVIEIGRSAFSMCTSVESLYLPDSVSAAGESAFAGCASLQHIRLSDHLTAIPDYMLSNCGNLKELYIPDSVVSVGREALYNCSSLENIRMGNGVTSLGYGAFRDCVSLKQFVFSDSIDTVNTACSPFFGCSGLEYVRFGAGMETVPYGLFSNLGSLKTVILGPNTNTVNYAFYYCYGFETLIVQSEEITFDGFAFLQCRYPHIYYPGTEDAWNQCTFEVYSMISFCSVTCNADVNSMIGAQTEKEVQDNFAYILWQADSTDYEISVNDTVHFSYAVMRTNQLDTSESDLGLYSSVKGCVSFGETDFEDGWYSSSFTAKEQGVTRVILSDSASGAYYSVIVRVECPPEIIEAADGIYTYSLSAIPQTTKWVYDNNYQNGCIDGVYITNMKCTASDLGATSYTVTFNAYNSNYCCAAADVYDKDGVWVDTRKIERYTQPEDLVETLGKFKGNIQEILRNSLYEKTEVELTVPAGGYFTVSCNVLQSRGALIFNLKAGIEALYNFLGNISEQETAVSVPNGKFWKSVVQKLEEKGLDFLVDYVEAVFEKLFSELPDIILPSVLTEKADSDWIWDALNTIDIKEYLEEGSDATVSSTLDIFEDLIDKNGYLDFIFAVASFNNLAYLFFAIENQYDRSHLTYYAPQNAADVIVHGISFSGNAIVNDAYAYPQVFEIRTEEAKNAVTSADPLTGEFDGVKVYNICLVNDEHAVQPDGIITIRIPLWTDAVPSSVTVRRKSADGNETWETLKSWVENGYLVFETTHFCFFEVLYNSVVPGDVDRDGSITAYDARLALRQAVGLETYAADSAAFLACDVDFDNAVTAADARLILRAAVELEVLKPKKNNKAFC